MGKFISFFLVLILSGIAIFGQNKKPPNSILFCNWTYNKPYSQFEPLTSPPADMSHINLFLNSCGIKIDVPKQNFDTKEKFFQILDAFIKDCKENKYTDIIIYYSGHGLRTAGTDFLVPTDFSLNIDTIINSRQKNIWSDFLKDAFLNSAGQNFRNDKSRILQEYIIENCVSLTSVLDSLKDFKVMFILDACRSDPSQEEDVDSSEQGNISPTNLKIWCESKFTTDSANKKFEELLDLWYRYEKNSERTRIKLAEHTTDVIENGFTTTGKAICIWKAACPYKKSFENPMFNFSYFTECFVKKLSEKNGIREINNDLKIDIQNCVTKNLTSNDPTIKQTVSLNYNSNSFFFNIPTQVVNDRKFINPDDYIYDTQTKNLPANEQSQTIMSEDGESKFFITSIFSFGNRRLDVTIGWTLKAGADSIFKHYFNYSYKLIDANRNVLVSGTSDGLSASQYNSIFHTTLTLPNLEKGLCNKYYSFVFEPTCGKDKYDMTR